MTHQQAEAQARAWLTAMWAADDVSRGTIIESLAQQFLSTQAACLEEAAKDMAVVTQIPPFHEPDKNVGWNAARKLFLDMLHKLAKERRG